MTAPMKRQSPRYRSRNGTTVRPSRQRQLATLRHPHPQQPNAVSIAPAHSRPLDGYVRVSRVGGRSGQRFISPEVQEEQIRAYARARGREVGTVFHELDRSGTTFRRALEDKRHSSEVDR